MKKYSLYSISIVVILFLLSLGYFELGNSKNEPNSWIGSYEFYEFVPPDQTMEYLIDIYEEQGLYANIKMEGFQTFCRLKAKVWSHGDEIMFVFYDNYVDEEGKTTITPWYDASEILLKLKKQGGIILTEWKEIRPLLIKNEKIGQYFTKVIK